MAAATLMVEELHTVPADTGCEVSERCLECPLSRCRYDDEEWWNDLNATVRTYAMVQEFEAGERNNRSAQAVGWKNGFTVRTVYRAAQRLRERRVIYGEIFDADVQVLAAAGPGRWITPLVARRILKARKREVGVKSLAETFGVDAGWLRQSLKDGRLEHMAAGTSV